MNPAVLILCFLLGTVMTLHVSMNARIGTVTGDPIFTNMVFWILGAVVAIFSWAVKPGKLRISEALSVPLWLYSAGILGVLISLAIVYLIPRAGIANFTILILAGQLLCSALLSHTGFLSDAGIPFSPLKLLGFVLVFAGGWLVVRS